MPTSTEGLKMPNAFTEQQRRQILERDNYRCAYCGELARFVDHVLPRSKGGEATLDNGVAACRSCNGKKAAKLDMVIMARGFFVASGGSDGYRDGNIDTQRHPSISDQGRIEPAAVLSRSRDNKSKSELMGTGAEPSELASSRPHRRNFGVPRKSVISKRACYRPAKVDNALAYLRYERGMTQAALAAIVGVPRFFISWFETGCANPNPTDMDAIAAALGKPVTAVFDISKEV